MYRILSLEKDLSSFPNFIRKGTVEKKIKVENEFLLLAFELLKVL